MNLTMLPQSVFISLPHTALVGEMDAVRVIYSGLLLIALIGYGICQFVRRVRS